MYNYPRVGLGVLIFNPEGYLLLGKRLSAHGAATFGPPGGHLEYGESLETCATREVLEETGLCITQFEFLGISNDVFPLDEKHYISIFMKAFLPSGQSPNNQEPHKIESWEWFPLDKLPSVLFLPLRTFLLGQSYTSLHCHQSIGV